MIALDTSTNGGSATATNLTYTHICTGLNLVLFVATVTNTADNTDYVTGVTYNGVTMSLVGSFASQGLGGTKLWMLVNPATGSNSVSVTLSSAKEIHSVSASYTGALQTGQPDATNQSVTDPTSSLTVNTTIIADSCWLVSIAGVKAGSGQSPAASTNTTSRQSQTYVGIGDSNAAETPAGSFGQTWTVSSTGLAVIAASISPAPVVSGGFFLAAQ